MTSQLLQDFPELSNLTREDLEDMLSDPVYFQAIFHSLQHVKDLYNSQTELGMANEAIASRYFSLNYPALLTLRQEHNLGLQQNLYDLRTETKDAFDEAKRLEARWKELEKEQREVYQRFTPQFLLLRLRHSVTAQDEASEEVASSFIRKVSLRQPEDHGVSRIGQDVDEFIREYKESRKTYHKRALWAEKWTNGQVIWRDK